MALLDKSQLLSVDSRKVEEYEIESLGGAVRIREMSTAQRLKVSEYNDKGNTRNTVAYMLASSLVDDNNEPILEQKDAYQFMDQNGSVTDEITTLVAKINGLNENAVDDAEKN